jgi:anti-anti-sigma factor
LARGRSVKKSLHYLRSFIVRTEEIPMTESEVDVVREEPGKAVARFIGEHDLTTRVSTIDLLQQLIAENDHVTVDLSDATFIDSSFLHALVVANRSAVDRGIRFRVQLNTSPGIENVFKISGLIDSLDCFYGDDQTLPPPPLPEEFTKAVSP